MASMIRYPYLTGEASGNAPDASTAYDLSGTALAGARDIAQAVSDDGIDDGDQFWIYAYEYDANGNPNGAAEICLCTYTAGGTNTLVRGSLRFSTTGSKIDWSATGVNFTPRLRVIGTDESQPRITQLLTLSAASSFDVKMRAGCSYEIECEAFDFSNDGVSLEAQVSTDGTTFDGGAGAYSWSAMYAAAAAPGGTGGASATAISVWGALFGNADVKEQMSGVIEVIGAGNSAMHTRVIGRLRAATNTNAEFLIVYGGSRLAAQADVAIRFAPSAGTISGRVTVRERVTQ